MMRAAGKIDQLFRMLVRELRHVLAGHCGVTGIRRGTRIAASNLTREGTEADRAGPAAVADAGELAVPFIERHPDFEHDVRLARRRDLTRDAAERRQIRNRVG